MTPEEIEQSAQRFTDNMPVSGDDFQLAARCVRARIEEDGTPVLMDLHFEWDESSETDG